jgi:hypothetical protein
MPVGIPWWCLRDDTQNRLLSLLQLVFLWHVLCARWHLKARSRRMSTNDYEHDLFEYLLGNSFPLRPVLLHFEQQANSMNSEYYVPKHNRKQPSCFTGNLHHGLGENYLRRTLLCNVLTRQHCANCFVIQRVPQPMKPAPAHARERSAHHHTTTCRHLRQTTQPTNQVILYSSQ